MSRSVDGPAALAPQSLLGRYQGPGVLISFSGQVVAESLTGAALSAMLVCERSSLTDLGSELFGLAAKGAAVSRRCVLPAPDNPQRTAAYDLTALPLSLNEDAEPCLLVLARDASLERNLIEALINSRALYRDLADCSGDFIWEMDAAARFSFVSPKGAVGYLPHALNGASAAGLALDPQEAQNLIALFAAREPVTDREIWVRAEDGSAACLVASVRPIFDDLGKWAGARGVARDVTPERRRERELNEQRDDDALISAIARAVQQEMQPDDMLQAATRVLVQAFHAAAAWIVPLRANGTPAAQPAFHGMPAIPPELPEHVFDELMEAATPSDEDASAYRIWRQGAYLCLMTHHWDVVNGLVVLLDATGRAEAMLAHAADHLANAVEQARQLRELDRLSRTDELTGLLNRRAFIAGVSAELEARDRAGAGALMFLDMDNFKAVNDTHGHPAGDALLVALADLLSDVVASAPGGGSFAARLGGDEFALWLGGADNALATMSAERLLRGFERIAAEYDGEAVPGLSVGVALAAAGEALPDVMARADNVLYEVKRSGKGAWKIAEDGPDAEPEKVRA